MSSSQKIILAIFIVYLALNAIIGIVSVSVNSRERSSILPRKRSSLSAEET